jgi:hypothetical protein
VIATSSPDAPLPGELEDRLPEFTEQVATALANSEVHKELARLAREQAALRHVATLVARGIAPADLFETVSVEVARLIPAEGAALTRFEHDGTVTRPWRLDEHRWLRPRWPALRPRGHGIGPRLGSGWSCAHR